VILLLGLWLIAFFGPLGGLPLQLCQVFLPCVLFYGSFDLHQAATLGVVSFQLPMVIALSVSKGLLALLSSPSILLALSLSIALLDPLEQSEVVLPKGLDDGLKANLSFAFGGVLLCEVESREGFDGRLRHEWKVSLTNDRNNIA
jgi:hypothetical protein